MIKLQNINKYYHRGKSNELHVLNEINLTLPDKGFITILGNSGSGKTTLLNVLGGLDKATGTIEYSEFKTNKYDMRRIDSFRRNNIGYVFQNYNLLTDLTIDENLRIALEVINITDKKEVKKRIEYALKLVGLYKYRKKPAYALSGGQMQRVSIARAIIKNTKIIIADEPTGNLDSENSIQVMNILKKISQTSLVILVTHDKQFAEFYSDRIIEISDGKITKTREPISNASLNNGNNDTSIYIKDLSQINGNGEKLHYKLYLEDKNCEDLEFTIFQKNDQFYIQSNKKIKLLDESSINLIDDHKKEIKIEDINQSDIYDTSTFVDKKNKNFFSYIWSNFKTSFLSYRQKGKKSRLFHFALALIGFVLSMLSILYANYDFVDDSNFYFDNSTYGIYHYRSFVDKNGISDYDNLIMEAIKTDAIDEFVFKGNFNIEFSVNSFYSSRTTNDVLKLHMGQIDDNGLIEGRMPEKNGEIVIGRTLADDILKDIKDSNANYDSILNNKCQVDSYSCEIVGVTKSEGRSVYFKDKPENNEVSLVFPSLANYNEAEINVPNIAYYPYEKDRINIIYGSGLESNQTGKYLLNLSSVYDLNSFNTLDEQNKNSVLERIFNENKTVSLSFTDSDLEIAGIYLYKDPMFPVKGQKYIVNEEKYINYVDYRQFSLVKDKIKYYVTEGEDIKNSLEALVPAYSEFSVGDTKDGIKIVGKYVLAEVGSISLPNSALSLTLVDSRTAEYLDLISKTSIYSHYNQSFFFTVKDHAKMNEVIKKYDASYGKTYSVQYQEMKDLTQDGKNILLPVMLVLFLLALIYIYFTMRSKMLKEIYSIGVYRAIGYSRARIILKYAIDIFVITLFTSLIGYIIGPIIYDFFTVKANGYGITIPLLFNCWMTYFVFFGIIILNVVIGLLPIILLLRKTPSEIIAKYDI